LDVRNKTSKIVIGENTSINNGFVAIAEHTSIKIGARVLIGTNVEIFDSDFHGINLSDRNTSKPEWARSVEVGDDVFIGSNVRICKGVTIGAGSVIANGSIVTHDVPVGVIAAGNPAVIVRRII
jgi:maltose O-acetyltransferase